tara:strand:+ start:2005 stop:2484 length:480 start_codon:yes stop_codon:yes gene_type:complete
MKYFTTIVASMFMFATVAHGTEVRKGSPEIVEGLLTHSYSTLEIQHRQNNRVCQDVDVPVYSTDDKAGEIAIGAILGGIIGKQVGDDDGATALGAWLGGAIANENAEKNKTIIGYKRTTICEDNPTYVTEIRKVYEHSTITFTDRHGQTYDIRFIRQDN